MPAALERALNLAVGKMGVTCCGCCSYGPLELSLQFSLQDLIPLSCLGNGGFAGSRLLRFCGATRAPALLRTSVHQCAAWFALGNAGAAGALGWAAGRAAQKLACLLFGFPQP